MNKWIGQLVFGIILAGVSIVVLVLNLKWIDAVFAGPAPIKLDDLRNVKNPRELPNQWVSFIFTKGIDTGVALVSDRSKTPKARYLLVQVQDRWMIVEVPPDHAGNEVIGYVEAWSAPLNQKVIRDIGAKFPDRPLLPIQVDAVYSQRGQCYALLAIMGFLLVFGLGLVIMSFVTRRRQVDEGY